MKLIPLFLLVLFACDSGDDEQQTEITPAGEGIMVYNQAYQENYAADNIADILANARNAYVLVDPFGNDVPASIPAIKASGNQVGAYISIGTGETYREDFSQLRPYLVSKQWGEWPDEYFVDVAGAAVVSIMKARIDRIAAWGADWVEFDNMDWVFDDEYRSEYGITTSQDEGIAYYQTLCAYVHEKGMKCMAKNTVDGAEAFEGVLYESYSDDKNWWDVSGAKSFVKAGKLVIINHYDEANCGRVYADYTKEYGSSLSYICEDANLRAYAHFGK